jgi:hypothetical protein
MLTCNLSKTMHNIQLQQLGKQGACLYVITSDDYVRTFRQNSLYKDYLKGGWFG